MRRIVLAVVLCLLPASRAACLAQGNDAAVEERGVYKTYLLLHAVGSETYAVSASGPAGSVMTIASTLSDRGATRASTTTLKMGADFAPTLLELKREARRPTEIWRTRVDATSATVQEAAASRTRSKPAVAYVGFSLMPAALQMMMMRYWTLHHGAGQPAHPARQ